MAELIDKGALLADFNNGGIHIEFDLPVEEILGEDIDIDDFAMLVQDAIQAYRKMVIGTIQKQPTTTEAEIRASAIDEFAEKLKAKIEEVYSAPERESEYNHAWKTVCRIIQGNIEVIAEQLKEE